MYNVPHRRLRIRHYQWHGSGKLYIDLMNNLSHVSVCHLNEMCVCPPRREYQRSATMG